MKTNLPSLKDLGLQHKDKRIKISSEIRQAILADCNKVPREPFTAIAKRYGVSSTAVRWIYNPEQIKACHKRYRETHKRSYEDRKADIYRHREYLKSLIKQERKCAYQ